jgi:hypothetical protein
MDFYNDLQSSKMMLMENIDKNDKFYNQPRMTVISVEYWPFFHYKERKYLNGEVILYF